MVAIVSQEPRGFSPENSTTLRGGKPSIAHQSSQTSVDRSCHGDAMAPMERLSGADHPCEANDEEWHSTAQMSGTEDRLTYLPKFWSYSDVKCL